MKGKFIASLVTLLSALTTVTAGPAFNPAMDDSSHDPSTLVKRKDCPPLVEGYYLGECNGTSCLWRGVNLPCDVGKCTGEGGGDGSCCHVKDQVVCPNGGFD